MEKSHNIIEYWSYPFLKDIVISEKGKKPKAFSFQPDKGFIPYLDIKALETGDIDRYAEEESSKILDDTSIAIVWDGSRSGWVEKGKSGAIGSTIVKIKPFVLDVDYLFFFLRYNYSYLNINARGTGIPHVDPKILWNIKVPLPPVNEQFRIIEKIEKFLKIIEQGEEHIKNAQYQLKLYRESILQKAFTGQLSEQWRNDHQIQYASEITELIKVERQKYYQDLLKSWEEAVSKWQKDDRKERKPIKPRVLKNYSRFTNDQISELPELPESWTWIKLGQISEIVGGVTKGRKLIGRKTVTTPYLRVANVQDGYLDLNEVKEIEVLPEDVTKYRLEPGDVLYIEGGDKDKLGRGTIWNNELPTCIHQNHVFRARMINRKVNIPEFIAYNSQTQVAKGYFFNNAKQTVNLASINMTVLSELPVPLCSMEEQKEIIGQLEKLFTKQEELNQTIDFALKDAQTLRQSILKKAFEGKLVPQDPNDDPATELLGKIQNEKQKWQKSQKDKKKISKPKTRMEALTIEQVLKKAKEPISPN